jgi:hypothetical protein
LASRSRKRAPRAAGAVPAAQPAGGADAGGTADPGEGLTRAQKREAANEEIRQGLEPLAPGERPRWVTIAALFALALGVLNIGLYAAGVRAQDANFTGTVLVGVVLLVAAGGMWKAQYWAVLGFEFLLGISCTVAALSLMIASSWSGALRAVIVMGVCGTLFWKLIRSMARLQMPSRPGA